MRRLWPGCCLIAALAACKTGGEQAAPTPALSAAAAPSASASSTALAARREKPTPVPREGSTIARSPTSDALYIADEDHGVVRRVRLPLDVDAPALAIPMPGQPAQVLVLRDRVLVTIRSAGAVPPGAVGLDGPEPAAPPDASAAAPTSSAARRPPPASSASAAKRFTGRAPLVPSATGPGLLLIFRPDPDKGLVELARVELPQDAWGVAVTPDESTALVSSAWAHRVSAVDLATSKLRWTVDVPREPRAIVVRPDGHAAYVTHLVGADLTRIDDLEGSTPRVRSIPFPAAPLRTPVGKRLGASLAYSAALSPDGRRLFVPRHALGALGAQAWFGAATVDVLLTGDDTPLAPMRRDGPRAVASEARGMLADVPAGGDGPRVKPAPFAQPRAVAYLAKTDALLVLGEGNDGIAMLDARAVAPAMNVLRTEGLAHDDKPIPVPRTCGAPSGLALSADEETAWIYCRSTDDLLVWKVAPHGSLPVMHLADDLLPADAALGRRIYYNGTDDLTSGGLGCAGCHPDGRDDGHVWHETAGVRAGHPTFVSGPEVVASDTPEDAGYARQTPMLAGRVAVEGPYGWHAESGVLTHRLINGFALHRWSDSEHPHERRELFDRAMALRAFLRKGLVPPPHQERELSVEEKRGREVFLGGRTGCAVCHVPATEYTDREAYPVFASLPALPGFAEDPDKPFKTPSLRFVGGTPPYLHDGRFPTLRALIAGNDDHMGKTNGLSATEKADLVAFLETL